MTAAITEHVTVIVTVTVITMSVPVTVIETVVQHQRLHLHVCDARGSISNRLLCGLLLFPPVPLRLFLLLSLVRQRLTHTTHTPRQIAAHNPRQIVQKLSRRFPWTHNSRHARYDSGSDKRKRRTPPPNHRWINPTR